MNTHTRGFTIIELIVVIVILTGASLLFFVQKGNLESASRDNMRKTSINAIHYSLEEVYFKANKAYPRTVSSENLPSVDPDLFKDTDGVKIGETASSFRYEATDCNGEACKAYTLRTTLENEADYIKKNAH